MLLVLVLLGVLIMVCCVRLLLFVELILVVMVLFGVVIWGLGLLFSVGLLIIFMGCCVVEVICFVGNGLGFIMGFWLGVGGIFMNMFWLLVFLLFSILGKKMIVIVISIMVFINLFCNVDVIIVLFCCYFSVLCGNVKIFVIVWNDLIIKISVLLVVWFCVVWNVFIMWVYCCWDCLVGIVLFNILVDSFCGFFVEVRY